MAAKALAGRTLFITGASRGIGKAIALRAAADGANIVIAAKTAEPHPKLPGTIYTAAKEIEEAGGKALPCVVDIRNESAVEDAVMRAVECFGGIDIVINNASAISLTGTLATPMKRFDLMNQVNARGTFVTTQKCLPYLKRSPNPHVLTISPPINMNKRWFKNHVAYTIAKYGMSMCTLGWSEELKDDGIAANCLWPRTAIATAAMEMLGGEEGIKQCRTAEIMADAAYYILTADSRNCTGHFFIDEEVVREHEPDVNMDKYACVPGTKEFMVDFFLDDASSEHQQTAPNQTIKEEKSDSASSAGALEKIFQVIESTVKADPSLVSKVNGIYQFDIASGDDVKQWTVDLKNGKGDVVRGASSSEPAGCVIKMKEQDFVDMVSGKLKGQMAFMSGRLKVSGNMGMAMKLESLFKSRAKL